MKVKCTNKADGVEVLAFVTSDGRVLAGISIDDAEFDAQIGDEFRLVKIKRSVRKKVVHKGSGNSRRPR